MAEGIRGRVGRFGVWHRGTPSPELAQEKGIQNLDWCIVETPRGQIEAKALVTRRMRPFTINGQTYPEVTVADSKGEIWRVLNAGANATHEVALVDDASGKDIPVQVLSIDGVAFNTASGRTLAELQDLVGPKLRLADCGAPRPSGNGRDETICATRILMMPSSRVTGRRTKGRPDDPLLPSLRSLRRLSLNDVDIGDRGLRALSHSPLAGTLTHLDLYENTRLTAGGVRTTASGLLRSRPSSFNAAASGSKSAR